MKQNKIRIPMMMAGVLAIFLTGFSHIWSIYQGYVMEETGWSAGTASLCFYLCLAFFVLGNLCGGPLQKKVGTRKTMFLGLGAMTLGVFLAAFSLCPNPVWMYLTYGMLHGVGQGFIYSNILSIAQRWFPEKPGFASGVIITANGLCGLILTPVSKALLNAGGPKRALLVLSLLFALAWILGVWFIREPSAAGNSGSISQGKKQYTVKEMLKTKSFYLMAGTMLFGLLSYFLVSPNSQAVQLERAVPQSVAVSAVMMGSVANALMRLLLPTLADRLGRLRMLFINLVVSGLGMILMLVSHSYLTTAAVVIIYMCYGGILASFPSITSMLFGLENSASNYGVALLGFGVATLMAPVILKITGNAGFQGAFIIGLVGTILAIVCLLALEKESKKLQ